MGDTVDITKGGLMISGAAEFHRIFILTHSFKMELTFQSLLEKVRYLYNLIDRKRQTAGVYGCTMTKDVKEKRCGYSGQRTLLPSQSIKANILSEGGIIAEHEQNVQKVLAVVILLVRRRRWE